MKRDESGLNRRAQLMIIMPIVITIKTMLEPQPSVSFSSGELPSDVELELLLVPLDPLVISFKALSKLDNALPYAAAMSVEPPLNQKKQPIIKATVAVVIIIVSTSKVPIFHALPSSSVVAASIIYSLKLYAPIKM